MSPVWLPTGTQKIFIRLTTYTHGGRHITCSNEGMGVEDMKCLPLGIGYTLLIFDTYQHVGYLNL